MWTGAGTTIHQATSNYMKSLWNDTSATRMIEHYQAHGIEESMALRVYTSRLLGGNPSLVLHGGGNTSYKTRATDLIGQSHQVLCIKGSGWDLDTIEPAGLPAVKLQPLLEAKKMEQLSDENMVALQRHWPSARFGSPVMNLC